MPQGVQIRPEVSTDILHLCVIEAGPTCIACLPQGMSDVHDDVEDVPGTRRTCQQYWCLIFTRNALESRAEGAVSRMTFKACSSWCTCSLV